MHPMSITLRRAGLLAGLTTAATLGAGSSAAASAWSVAAPQQLSPGSRAPGGMATNRSGAGLISWLSPAPNGAYRPVVATFGADGVRGQSLDVEPGLDPGSLSVDAAGRGLLVGARPELRGIVAQSVDATGRPGAVQVVRRATVFTYPVLATNDAGDAVLAWTEPFGKAGVRVRVATRKAGARFGASKSLGAIRESADLTPGSLAVAISARGRIAVAYSGQLDRVNVSAERVVAWSGALGGRFSAPAVVGSQRGTADLAAAIDGKGRTFVAWSTQSAGEAVHSGLIFRAASRARDARAFQPTQTLDPGGVRHRLSEVPVLMGEPRGGATVMWTSHRTAAPVARVAHASAAGRFAASQGLPSSTRAGRLLLDGDALAASFETPAGIGVVRRPTPTAAFELVEPTGLPAGPHRLLDAADGGLRVAEIVDGDNGAPAVLLVATAVGG